MKRWEKKLQDELLLQVGALPWVRLWRNNVGAARPLSSPGSVVQYGRKGMADLLGVMAPSGRILSLEVKSAGGTVSRPQRAWANMIARFGGIHLTPQLPRSTSDDTLDTEIAAVVAAVIAQLEQLR